MSKILTSFISQMTQKEKAYFKRYTRIHSDKTDKNYLKLYDFFEQQEVYDDKKLKLAFKDERFLKYISSEKNYLLEQLLTSLVNMHSDSSNYQKLIKWILFIDLLFKRGFRKKSQRLLIRAKELAYKYEEFSIILKLIELEEKILFQRGILNFTKKLQTLKEERETIVRQIQNLNDLRLLQELVRDLQLSKNYITNPEDFPHIFNLPLLENEENALSLKAKVLWYYVIGFRSYLLRQFETCQNTDKYLAKFAVKHDYFFETMEQLRYISNYLFLSAKIRKSSDFYDAIDMLNTFTNRDDVDLYYVDYIRYSRLLEFAYKMEKNELTIKILPDVANFIQQAKEQLGKTEVDYVYLLIVRATIVLDDFEKAHYWINEWNNSIVLNYNLIKLFTFITYFEMGYFNLMESEINNTYRLLKKQKRLHKLERLFIRIFKRLAKSSRDKKTQISILETFKIKLQEISTDDKENIYFDYLNFVKWCDHKIKRLDKKIF